MVVRNTFIIFLVSGFWHGSNWTFIAWGALNAIYFLPLSLMKRNRNNLEIVAQGRLLPSLRDLMNMGITFSLTVFAWIFFRADSIRHAMAYIKVIFSRSLLSRPEMTPKTILAYLAIFIAVEWVGRENQYAIATLGARLPKPVRWVMYYSIAIAIIFLSGNQQKFIYFQF